MPLTDLKTERIATLPEAHAVLRALADPHRLEILSLVWQREMPAGQIARQFHLTRTSVSGHLRILEDAGLLDQRKEGSHRLYRARPKRLSQSSWSDPATGASAASPDEPHRHLVGWPEGCRPSAAGSTSMDSELRVLLIEDDPAVAEMYKYRLEIDGYAVTVASDGETGLALATASPPDLVYLDLRLPVMDGFAVLQRLRGDDRTSGLPVVILTNYSEPELVSRGRELGALDFLIKSETSPAALVKRMESWLQAERIAARAGSAAEG